MKSSCPVLSFIIPAYNEEDNILSTIESIKKYVPEKISYEILVIDHESSDGTALIAKSSGAKVITHAAKTVAELRNYGAKLAVGDIFIFLDADISLTKEWGSNIENVISRINTEDGLLTGSWVSIPENPSSLEKYWFEPQQTRKNTHINSGHMIIGSANFFKIDGFQEKLETGEDYEISMRAKKSGLKVTEIPELKVIHEGYPKNLLEFFKREFWHGKGDSISLKNILSSKVAVLSISFLVFHICLLFSIFVLKAEVAIMIFAALIVAICLVSSYVKFKNESPMIILIDSMYYYFYFMARGFSTISGFFSKEIRKRVR